MELIAVFCSFCGAKLEENSNFCTQCGAAISGVATQNQSVVEEKQVFQPPVDNFAYPIEPVYDFTAPEYAPPSSKKKAAKVVATIFTVIAIVLYVLQVLSIAGGALEKLSYAFMIAEMLPGSEGAIYIVSFIFGFFLVSIIATILMLIAYFLKKYARK